MAKELNQKKDCRITTIQYEALLKLSKKLNNAENFHDIGKLAFENLQDINDISDYGGKLAVYYREEDLYRIVFTYHQKIPQIKVDTDCRLNDLNFFSKYAIDTGKTLLINNSYSEFAISIDERIKLISPRSMIYIPLFHKDLLIGLFSYSCSPINSIEKIFVLFLEKMCEYIAYNITRLLEERKRKKTEQSLKFNKDLKILYNKNLSSITNDRTQPDDRSFQGIITINTKMWEIFRDVQRISKSDYTVLIEGESGTGKELLARAIFNLSNRKHKLFGIINCCTLTVSLAESELFGYVKGAFTGADKSMKGFIPAADGGTVFFDEIGELSLSLQSKLLRLSEYGEYSPVGDHKTYKCDIRIIAATNKNLKEMIEKKEFREDLYYRLNCSKFILPPLNERKEDLPLLVNHFIKEFNEVNNKNIKGIRPEVMDILQKHNYPGNVRELMHIILNACLYCDGDFIGIEDLPDEFLESINYNVCTDNPGDIELMEKSEAQIIEEALRRNKGCRKKTALELKMHRVTLWEKMNKYKIQIYK